MNFHNDVQLLKVFKAFKTVPHHQSKYYDHIVICMVSFVKVVTIAPSEIRSQARVAQSTIPLYSYIIFDQRSSALRAFANTYK